MNDIEQIIEAGIKKYRAITTKGIIHAEDINPAREKRYNDMATQCFILEVEAIVKELESLTKKTQNTDIFLRFNHYTNLLTELKKRV